MGPRSSEGVETIVRFEVSDTGDGIAPDKLEMIFQPFVQADSSTSRKYGGTGLGLAISGQLVTLMGVTAACPADSGQGSTFWFTIAWSCRTRARGAGSAASRRRPRRCSAP